jgi:hypothetical protein
MIVEMQSLFVRIVSAAMLFIFACTASPVYAKKHQPDGHLNYMAAPGPQPALNERDYDAYRRPGTATVSGHLHAAFPEPSNTCSNRVFLYPATTYTAWMLQKWAYDADGQPFMGRVYPDSDGTGIQVPPYLTRWDPDVVSAVQTGTCNNGDVYFSNVPAGLYYFVMGVQRTAPDCGSGSNYTWVNVPQGQELVISPRILDGDGLMKLDGFVLISKTYYEIKAGGNYELPPDTIAPVAHFLDSFHNDPNKC